MIPVLFLHHNQHACFVPSNKHFTSLFDSRQLFASSLYSLLAVCEPNTHWAIQSTFCVEKKIHRCEQVLTFLTETVEHRLITYSRVSPLCLGARALKNQYPHSVERRASAAWASNQWIPGQAGQTQDWRAIATSAGTHWPATFCFNISKSFHARACCLDLCLLTWKHWLPMQSTCQQREEHAIL